MNLKHLNSSLVLQQDQSDCGVACLLSLLQYYGGSDTLEHLRELSGTSRKGTTLLGLYQAANQIGFKAEGFEADIEALIKHEYPVILHVIVDNKRAHYLVSFGFENDKFIIGDPSIGVIYYDISELLKVWQSKACLTLRPNVDFIHRQDIGKSKKAWFLDLLRPDLSLLWIGIAIGIVISVLGIVVTVFSQKLIDTLIPLKDSQKIILGIISVTILLLIQVILKALRSYIITRQSLNFNNRIINNFYNKLLHLPKPFFDTRKIGDLVARINDATRIQQVLNEISGNLTIDVLILTFSIVFIFIYSWQCGVLTCIILPIYLAILSTFNNAIVVRQRNVMQSFALNEGNFISTIKGVEVIKHFNRQNTFSDLNRNFYGNYQDRVFDLGTINIKLGLISGIGGVVFLITVLSYTVYNVYNGSMLIGEMMAIIGLSVSLLPSVTNLALIMIPINEAKVAFDRMFEFVGLKSENSEQDQEEFFFKNLVIKNLSFGFPGRQQILVDINLEIERGALIAIIGESGSGKSTLSQLLLKFYNPEGGEILFNGKSLQSVNSISWRKILGVVPQEIHIFNGSILDNIVLSENNSKELILKVISFCEKYGFDKFFESFPNGYYTIIGEEGINVSGGQKQLIAIARALFIKPQLLILDEATSAMDKKTENFILQLILSLREELSVLMITHRIKAAQKANRIYILDNGEISCSGNHRELMSSDNYYSSSYKQLTEIE